MDLLVVNLCGNRFPNLQIFFNKCQAWLEKNPDAKSPQSMGQKHSGALVCMHKQNKPARR